eukprot:scaffold30998_cov80-Cyclotella_meneghiniana.AAC.1
MAKSVKSPSRKRKSKKSPVRPTLPSRTLPSRAAHPCVDVCSNKGGDVPVPMDTVLENLDMDDAGVVAEPIQAPPMSASKRDRQELLADIAATIHEHESPGGDPAQAETARNLYSAIYLNNQDPEAMNEFNAMAINNSINATLAGYSSRLSSPIHGDNNVVNDDNVNNLSQDLDDELSVEDNYISDEEIDEAILDILENDLAAEELGPECSVLRSPKRKALSRNSLLAQSPVRHELISCVMGDPIELDAFSTTDVMQRDGHDGYRAVAKGLSIVLSKQLETDSNLKDELHESPSGSIIFRYELSEFISSNLHRLIDSNDSIFLDEYGRPDTTFHMKFDGSGNAVFVGKDEFGRPTTAMDVILRRIYQ